jgi:hypothetical protein
MREIQNQTTSPLPLSDLSVPSSDIQTVSEMATAPTDAGYSLSSCIPIFSGSMIEESWSHPQHGFCCFRYEYGSDLIATEEDY